MTETKSRTALIDLGSNSARLLIVELKAGAGHTVLRQEKIMTRLGEGVFVHRRLAPQPMERALAALSDFSKIIRALNVDRVQAVATAATREALNQKAFLARVYAGTGLKLGVISGLEEARLIYLGVSRHLALDDRPALFLDIGGGSAEVIVGNKAGHQFLDSLPLGAVRLTGAFKLDGNDGRVSPETYQRLLAHVTKHSLRAAGALKKMPPLSLVYGSSGTIQNLAEVQAFRMAGGGRPPETQRAVKTGELRDLAGWLGRATQAERRKIAGLNPQRADVIVAGCAILEGLMRAFRVEEIKPVSKGLQEGLLVDLISRLGSQADLGLSTREVSVRNLGRRCGYDEEHAGLMAALAVQILNALAGAGLIEADARETELLRLAALVHDVGKFISYEKHHHHSWYLIENAELLGFDQDEIRLMAFLALSHRKKKKKETWPPGAQLVLNREKNAPALGLIMRLAEALEFGRGGLIKGVSVEVAGPEARFFLHSPQPQEISWETQNLTKLAKDFQKCFGLRLRVQAL